MSDKKTRQWVRDSLISLPDKNRNKNLTGSLARYAVMAEQSRDSLRFALRLADLVKMVFVDSSFPTLVDRVRKAANSARTCEKDVAKGMDAVAKKTFEERMISIKEFATAASKPVAETWAEKLASEIRAYEQVGRIVADRGLPGGAELNKKLSELGSRSSIPPRDEKDAADLIGMLRGLPQEVKALGLTGKAGKFLVAAAEGRGSAHDLEEPEVRELIDRYSLWSSLLVTMGPRK